MNRACRTALTYPCRLGFEQLKPLYLHPAGFDRLRLVVTVDAGYRELEKGPRWHAFVVKHEASDPILVAHLEQLCLEALLGAGELPAVMDTKSGSSNYMKDGIVRLARTTVVHVRKPLTPDELRDCGGAADIRANGAEMKRRVLEGLQYAPPNIVHEELREIEAWLFEASEQS